MGIVSCGRSAGTMAAGKIERIGLPDGILTAIDGETGQTRSTDIQVADHAAAVRLLIEQLARSARGYRFRRSAIGSCTEAVVMQILC